MGLWMPAASPLLRSRALLLLAILVFVIIQTPDEVAAKRIGVGVVHVSGIVCAPTLLNTNWNDIMKRFRSANPCPGVDMAMTQANFSLRMEGRSSVVFDVDLYVNKTATTISKLIFNLIRCKDVISRTSCRVPEVRAFTTSICTLLASPLMPWSPIMKKLEPPVNCPIKKGFYFARSVGADVEAAKAFLRPSDRAGTIFISQGKVFDQNRLPYACMEFVADVLPAPRRKP